MKYVKTFEDHKDLLDSFKKLADAMSKFKYAAKSEVRAKTPKEIYEDYFLEFKEIEKFKIDVRPNGHFGPSTITLYNMINLDTVESEFNRYLNMLKSIQLRLEEKFGFECLFTIKLNGENQADLDTVRHKNDDYKFKGLGKSKWGYDLTGHYSNTSFVGAIPFPEDKVSIIIEFLII